MSNLQIGFRIPVELFQVADKVLDHLVAKRGEWYTPSVIAKATKTTTEQVKVTCQWMAENGLLKSIPSGTSARFWVEK